MPSPHFAQTTDFAYVEELLTFGEAYEPQPGDTVEVETESATGPEGIATVVESSAEGRRVRINDSGQEFDLAADDWLHVQESSTISAMAQLHQSRSNPDGVAFADGIVEPALADRLRADFARLKEIEPVDYHPGSGTKVRDLVHPSLFPYVEGRSAPLKPIPVREPAQPDRGGRSFKNAVFQWLSTSFRLAPAEPTAAEPVSAEPTPRHDRFGRLFETSIYQWLPTPFRIDPDGGVTIPSYINNLDRGRHPAAYENLAALFATALPLIESVVGYVENSRFWQQDGEDESELPQGEDRAPRPAPPKPLRGRDLLVIPKLVEYRLGAGETHEGVWHVEGMSHEHIVATCLYVLDRDDALQGGELAFKRAYTLEEAGRLFWNIDQVRPAPVERLVEEGTVPVGKLLTPAGRMIVFPNSHIHKLSMMSVAAGSAEAFRRVIVFWIVDPGVAIPSTQDVSPQQAVMPRDEALAIRLALMEERKRHKQALNVRAVSLCEH